MINTISRLFLSLLLASMLCLNSKASNDSNIDVYFQDVANKCLNAYFQVPLWEAGTVSESFTLNSDGSASDIKIILHPKQYKTERTSAAADMALILAVKNATPFPPPPAVLVTPVKLMLTISQIAFNKPFEAQIEVL